MQAEQLDLFAAPETGAKPEPLNGFYYEERSRKFVSFAMGKRHFEILASRCNLPKDWQERIKKERVI